MPKCVPWPGRTATGSSTLPRLHGEGTCLHPTPLGARFSHLQRSPKYYSLELRVEGLVAAAAVMRVIRSRMNDDTGQVMQMMSMNSWTRCHQLGYVDSAAVTALTVLQLSIDDESWPTSAQLPGQHHAPQPVHAGAPSHLHKH